MLEWPSFGAAQKIKLNENVSYLKAEFILSASTHTDIILMCDCSIIIEIFNQQNLSFSNANISYRQSCFGDRNDVIG